MSRSTYTRSGTRRLGDDYQDIIGCEVAVDWLEHSDRYSWIRVEADDAKFLEDIVVMRADGRVEVKQVKFSTHPSGANDPFTWEKLLAESEAKSGKKIQSWLQKWAVSLRHLEGRYDIADASLVTNRIAGADLAASLDRTTALIDFDAIDDAVRARIIDQLEDEAGARNFFKVFRFRLNEPSLFDLEDALRRRFDRLGGTEIGWLSLKNELRLWVAHRYEPPPDGSIKLSDVRLAARWHALQSLPQRFEVPPDYVVPSVDFHEELQRNLLSQTKSCTVVTGSPGVGKSTYTSYLYEALKDSGVPVIRHHYYLSQEDETAGVRLSHLRAAESLMHDLKYNYSESLGSHGGDNPVAVRLRDWLTASGNFYARQNKPLIVILDGLDHVWRDTRSIEELSRLMNFMLPAPTGVVVVLATQPVSDNQLPPVLLQHAPRDSWQVLPRMNQNALLSWLRHHESEFLPPVTGSSHDDRVREYQFSRIAEALLEKSGGHPLHLRYTLRTLQERDQLVTADNIANLPGCEHDDIRDYYGKLWMSLSEEGKGILHLLAAAQFAWTKRAILECLSPDGTRYPILNQSIKEVGHLLSDTGVGLNAFHASLIVYVQALAEHADFRPAMLRNALSWLRNYAPEYVRWAHEWVIEAELGNDTGLREGPTREWVIQAIAKHYPSEEILNLLRRSIWCALENEDLPRAVEVGLLHDYCFRAFQSDPEILEQLLVAQLTGAADQELAARLSYEVSGLDESEISLLAQHEADRGNMRFVRECLDELIRRVNTPEEKTYVEWNSKALAVIEVAALLDDVNPAKIIDFALSNREHADVHEMLGTLAATLRTQKSSLRMKSVLALEPLTAGDFNVAMRVDERECIVRHAVWLALEEGFELHDEARKAENANNPYLLIYAAIKQTQGIDAQPSRLPDARFFESKNYSPGEPSRQRKDVFYSCFAGFLANYLWGFPQSNKRLIDSVGQHTKSGRCLIWLDLMASRIADSFRARKPVSFGLLYEGLKDFDDPAEGAAYDIEASGLRNDIARAVRHFALDLLSASVAIDGKAEIPKKDLESAFHSGYCHWDTWMNEYVSRRRAWLSQEALSWLLDDQKSRLETSIEPLPERAVTYVALASVAARHERISDARKLIELTVNNMVGHGNHKDVLFFHTLRAINECHRAGIVEAKEWLSQIATPISHVEQFTDGDETGHLPRELAEITLQVDPARFAAYYSWLCDNEESYDALQAFSSFVEIADLTSPLNRAIAATALDNGTLKILNKRAIQDTEAQAVLESARSALGEKGLQKSLREEARSSSNSFTPRSSPVPPSSYPPNKLAEYLAALDANGDVWKENHLEEWTEYWLTQNQDEPVYGALESAVARGAELRNYDQMFELALRLYGSEQAYPWLVKAHKEKHGWNTYYSREDEAHRRWKYVSDLYPDRWFDFIRRTLQSENENAPWMDIYLDSSRAARLIEYCVRLNKFETARETTKTLVGGSLQLVEVLPLTPPAWIDKN